MKAKEFWVFAAPSLLIMVLLMVGPLLFTLYLSFSQYSLGGAAPRLNGLDNYATVLSDPAFWRAVSFTLSYVAIAVPLIVLIGFGLALLLTELRRGKRLFISAYLLPFVVTPVVGTMIVAWLFRDRGFYSYLLSLIGVNVQWLAEPTAARALIIGYGVWAAVPFAMLMLYAGMQAMSQDPIEAAIVDGATWGQRVRYVVVPSLQPIFLFIIMITMMDGFRLFDSVAIMTRGGPGGATTTAMYYTYGVAFGDQLLGRGSAAIVLCMIGILILLSPFLYRTYQDTVKQRT